MKTRSNLKWVVCLVAATLTLTTAWIFYIFWGLPEIEALPKQLNLPSLRITDRQGRLLYEILPETGGRNAVLPIESIPDCMTAATLAVEDQNFYRNPGVDPTGILRAFWINLRGGETLAGGR